MTQDNIISRLPKLDSYRFYVDMSSFCWFGVGGKAAVLYKPQDSEELSFFMKHLPKDINYFVLGVGSNVLIPDSGFNGVIIRLGRKFNHISHIDCGDNAIVTAGAASLDLNVALYCAQNGLSGLEFLSGIPGTIGGALAMNAGAYGAELADVLIELEAVLQDGQIVKLSNSDMGYSYRAHSYNEPCIFTQAKLHANYADPDAISAKIQDIQSKRNATQPIKSKTGGSTFKNPQGFKAWELIDKAGCRGLRVGGAAISSMHCNFIVNDNLAKASDIIELIAEVKKRVLQTSGILLEEEIKILGN